VRVGFAARDGVGAAPVSYLVSAWNRFLLTAKAGTQVGNDRRVVRTLKLPRC